MSTNENQNKFARRAVDLGFLIASPPGQPFTNTKGRPSTNVILDVRGAASNIPLRSLLLGGLLNALSEFPNDAVIGGISRGGLVLGSQLALAAGRPFVAVLPDGPRAGGLRRSVEGNVRNRNVVLYDNIASSGRSLCNAAAQVEAAGGLVVGAVVVSTYETVPTLPFALHITLEFRDLIIAAHEAGLINTERLRRIKL